MDNNSFLSNNPYAKDEEQLLEQFIALYQALSSLPLRQPGRISAFGWDIEYVSAPGLIANIQYQVLKRINDFCPNNQSPVILDLGANIGISVLNYKRQFPEARITAFEPDPLFLPVLRKNLDRNGVSDVEVVEAAAWIADGEASWLCEGIDGSKLILDPSESSQTVIVPTIDLANYLNQEIDLIKMDIEGAELKVIPHLAGKLGSVKNLSIECHLGLGSTKAFCGLLETLVGEGFSVSINSYSEWRDLIRYSEPTPDHFWQYVTVSAWRNDPPPYRPSWGMMPSMDILFPITLLNQSHLTSQATSQYLESQESLARLSKQYLESQDTLASLRNQYLESQDTLASLRSQYLESQAALARLSDQYLESQDTLAKLSNQYVETQDALARLNTQYLESQKSLTQLSQQYQELSQQYQGLYQQNQELSQQHQELSQQHQELILQYEAASKFLEEYSRPFYIRVIRRILKKIGYR